MSKTALDEFDLSEGNFDVNPFNMEIGGHHFGLDELKELHDHYTNGRITAEDYIAVHDEILRHQELNVYQMWTPHPGPQLLAYLSKADELYYGGAAGGGKTDLLIGLALTAHRKSIIFRREYPQLKDVIARSQEIIGSKGKFNSHTNLWRGLPDKRSIELGAVQYKADRNKYKGRPHDLKAFDELPDFDEETYLFLSGWLRSAHGNRTRIVGAGNPPTEPEGWWVVKRWAPWLDPVHPNPARPGELRWFIRIDDEDREVEDDSPIKWKGEILYPKSRTFIPARLDDNPYLSTTNEYRSVLQNLPEPLRSQLLYGRFDLGISDNPWQVIPTKHLHAANERWKKIEQEVKEFMQGLRDKPPRFTAFSRVDTMGVDVARGGKAKTVIAKRSGNYIHPLKKIPGKDTPDGTSVLNQVVANGYRDGILVVMDSIGVGASAYDKCVEYDMMIEGFNGSNKSSARDVSGMMKMKNKRAEAYWKLRELLDPDITPEDELIALPPDSELLADLAAPRWKSTTQGIQIEEKEEIEKRIGRSPDCGDAVVYCTYGETEDYLISTSETIATGGSREGFSNINIIN